MTRVTPDKSPLVLRNNDGRLELWFNGEKIPGILGFRTPETKLGQRAIIEVVFTATAVKFETRERQDVKRETTSDTISAKDADLGHVFTKRLADKTPDELRQQFEAVFPPAAPGPIPDGYTFDPMTGTFGRFHDGAHYVSERSHFHHKWYSRHHEFPTYRGDVPPAEELKSQVTDETVEVEKKEAETFPQRVGRLVRPIHLSDRADLMRAVENVLNMPSAGHAAACELAETILDALEPLIRSAPGSHIADRQEEF